MSDVLRVEPEQVSARRSALRRQAVAGSPSVSPAATPPEATAPVPSGARHPSLDLLIENVAEILNSEVALYCRLNGTPRPPEVVCSWGLGAPHDELTRPPDGGLVGRALGAQRAVLEPLDPRRDAPLGEATGAGNLTYVLIAPIRPATGSAAALIAAFSARPREQMLTLWTAEACASMLALGTDRPGTLDTLLSAGRLDGLTGCLNYAATGRELEKEINRSTRGDRSLSLGFIDLDGFKRINDQHGHLRGNDVLREVSLVLRESVRSCDTVGRFGGDEFVVILPDTDEPAARRFAARLTSRLAAASVPAVDGPLTASVGVAAWTPGTTADELLARADDALLRAKAQARGDAGPRAPTKLRGRSAARH